MSKVKRITKDCQPMFPGWLWSELSTDEAWQRFPEWLAQGRPAQWGWAYWHPDQPEPPTERPDQPTKGPCGLRLEPLPEIISVASPLPPEVRAACERLKGYQYNEPLATDLRTLLAWVEGRKSP